MLWSTPSGRSRRRTPSRRLERTAMRPSKALSRNRDKVIEIIARYPVRNPRIFGSAARGEDREGSVGGPTLHSVRLSRGSGDRAETACDGRRTRGLARVMTVSDQTRDGSIILDVVFWGGANY